MISRKYLLVPLTLILIFIGLVIANNSTTSTVVINDKTYKAKGIPQQNGCCLTFVNAETNEIMTICESYENTSISPK